VLSAQVKFGGKNMKKIAILIIGVVAAVVVLSACTGRNNNHTRTTAQELNANTATYQGNTGTGSMGGQVGGNNNLMGDLGNTGNNGNNSRTGTNRGTHHNRGINNTHGRMKRGHGARVYEFTGDNFAGAHMLDGMGGRHARKIIFIFNDCNFDGNSLPSRLMNSDHHGHSGYNSHGINRAGTGITGNMGANSGMTNPNMNRGGTNQGTTNRTQTTANDGMFTAIELPMTMAQ